MIINKGLNKIKLIKWSSMILILLLFAYSMALPVYAVDTVPTEEWAEKWEQRKSEEVQTNLVTDWPQGPAIGAESAILMEADTGIILYAKNVEEKMYPASITKMMTALLTVENCSMEETVTFSDEAIDNTEWGSSRIGIMKGEELSVEDCLYGLLLGSANEVAYGLAEHVGGSLDNFVQMMNERAQELGCVNTHFANASGLPDDNHYVCAYDMALIAQAFFENDTLCMISGTYTYTIGPTNKTDESRVMENHHKMVTGKKYEYDGIVGGKTGFTSVARQTLVTCAQRDGMKLICVVMMDESPYQFTDTADLFDYGFDSFKKLKISDYETRYSIDSDNFFHTNVDIMGSSKSILTLNELGYVVIPKTVDFENVSVRVDYDTKAAGAVANLEYYIGDNKVGSTTIDYAGKEEKTFEFANIITDSTDESYTYVPEQKTVFVTVTDVLKKILIVIGILFLITVAVAMIFGFIRSAKRAQMQKKKRYKQRSENRRYDYKKRSENKRHKEPVENNKKAGKDYMEPMYKELSKRATSAAESKTVNEYDIKQKEKENALYFDNEFAENEDIIEPTGLYDRDYIEEEYMDNEPEKGEDYYGEPFDEEDEEDREPQDDRDKMYINPEYLEQVQRYINRQNSETAELWPIDDPRRWQ